MSGNSDAAIDRAKQFLGVGRTPLYASKHRAILFPEGSAEWDTYGDRFDAVCTAISILDPNATGSDPSNTLPAVIEAHANVPARHQTMRR